jgi:membrane associated rhomboid family serine protease
MYQNWTTSLRNVVQERFHTLLTPCVSHSDLAHLGGNLFALWLFGFKTCQAIGAFRFLALYATGGVVANVGHLLYTYIVKVPPGVKLVDFGDVPMTISIAPTEDAEEGDPKWEVNDPDLKDKHLFMLSKLDPPSLGASGSVMAISASAALLFPRDRISFVMRGLPLRLSLPFAVFLHVAGDFSGLTQPEKDDNIGHAAHLGGTLLGVVFTLVYWYSRRGLPGTLTHLPILNHLWKIWLGPRGHLAPWKNLKPTVQPLKSK